MKEITKYKTIVSNGIGDFRDRGSKFLAFAYPVNTTEEVKEKLSAIKKEHPKAVHHCYAYKIGIDGTSHRANDDGEPSGSAGKPILGQIESMDLTNTLVIVVRYFGGTLLGIPGLINAYKTATAQALTPIPTIEKWVENRYEITFDYPAMGEVLYILKHAESTIYKQELQLFCTVIAGIPILNTNHVLSKLVEIRNVQVKEVV